MHGRIVFINPVTETGMIFGADRNRYQFRLSDWEGDRIPTRNIEVAFATELYQAVKVRRATGQELTVDIFPETLPPVADATAAAHPAPDEDILTATPKDVAGFRDRMELDEEDDEAEKLIRSRATPDFPKAEEEETLGSGDIFPELNKADTVRSKRAAASPLFQVAGDKPGKGSSAKYYALGVVAALVLVVIAYIAVHL